MLEISSLVFFANDLTATAEFYRAIGVPWEDEAHEDEDPHVAAMIGGAHVAVYQAETGLGRRALGLRDAGSDFPGFYVDDLDSVEVALGPAVIEPHAERPWGCRLIALDPDGRAIEVNQRAHCPQR